MAAAGGWRAAGARRRRPRAAGGASSLRRLREARDALLGSGFWAACAGAVRGALGAEPPARCVGYGLGRFCSCPVARCQLALLLLLLDELRVPPSQCFVFDPAFSEQELALLGELGLRLLPENEEGKHRVGEAATLFYMIHCGKALYNNLLWSNWALGALSKVVIIGNSFRGIEDRLLSRILERDYSYIAKVLKGTEEIAFPTHPQYTDTFNDTSIHWFPLQKLKELPSEVWEFVEEPTYQECEDLEIIRKGDSVNPQCPPALEP